MPAVETAHVGVVAVGCGVVETRGWPFPTRIFPGPAGSGEDQGASGPPFAPILKTDFTDIRTSMGRHFLVEATRRLR